MELATGLNHFVNGQYVPSTEEIDVSPGGGSASATNGQHQVYFPGDIDNGAIKLVTPDEQTLVSQPIGLSYFDGSNSVLIAVLTNSTGEILTSGNQVMYTNAFAGLNADLLYTYTRAGFEQDVILRAQPPDPTSWGLNSQNTRIQVLTEFFNPPQPVVTTNMVPTTAGNLEDDDLNFGTMAMGQGKAFLLGTNSSPVGVVKQWLLVNNQQFLVEEVPFRFITNGLSQLPAPRTASIHNNPPLDVVSARRLLPVRPSVAARDNSHMRLAKSSLSDQGLVLDYQILNSRQTNYTFQGDTTYLISAPVYLYGTNIFEGGAVIKYTNNASMGLQYSVASRQWPGSPYRPVIFTSMNDNTVGESVPGSTGNPTNYYPTALSLAGNTSIQNVRILHAQYAIGAYGTLSLTNVQMVNCQNGVLFDNGYQSLYLYLRNVLMADLQTNINLTELFENGVGISAQNVTFANTNTTFAPVVGAGSDTSWSMSLTNCILARATLVGNYLTADYNGFYPAYIGFGSHQFGTSSSPFQIVAGANYYLANNSPFLGVGTNNIDPALLADLRTTTTYPPNTAFVGQTISISTNLAPLGLANTNTPDLGYHYPILDYVFSQCRVDGTSGGSITFKPGTAVGWYGLGVSLTNGSSLNFDGLVASPCYFVRCNTVQENDQSGDTNATGITCPDLNASSPVQATFTRFSAAGDLAAFFDASQLYPGYFYNCEFWDGLLGGNVPNGGIGSDFFLVNCLLDRSSTAYYTTATSTFWQLTMQNCTLHGGSLYLSQSNPSENASITVGDSAFDGTEITTTNTPNGTADISGDHDAYLTNATKLPGEENDLSAQTNFNWQTGFMGNYYLPPGSPLIDAGNEAASVIQDLTGYTTRDLGIFTTQTNQMPDNGPAVDIGYHHAAPLQAQSFNNYGGPYGSPFCPNTPSSISLSGPNQGWNNSTLDWWGLPVTYSTSQPQHGSLTNTDNAGDYKYTPSPCYEGADSFTYQMNDGLFTSPPATVYVMVAHAFNSTYYTPSPAQTPVNTALTITINAGNSCGDATNLVITFYPAHGTLSNLVANPPQFTTVYKPTNGFSGIDSFVFQVSNGCGDAASFLAFITVTNSGTSGPFTVVTNITGGPIGIDYSPKENALIVSGTGDPDFQYDNFVQLGTNAADALTMTNFSSVAGLQDEVEVVIVKQSTNGFTNSDVFFSSDTNVGWLSGDGTQSNQSWCILTNSTLANTMHLRGGLYVDQTGVFGNKLIELASMPSAPMSPEVWLVNSNGSPTLLAQIGPQIEANSGDNLEGVISLPNNTNQWGPWAGKILTGDEDWGILYTIATNGTITPYDLGIAPEHYALIPANQDLYVCDFNDVRILKMSHTFLTNYVGDLLITQEGGNNGNYPSELFIVNWNGTNFVTRAINANVITNGVGEFEDATFAPLNLPSQPIQ
ncbi:MAG TPA: Ig-like domain-containing protein [Candidatus Acidoferrales bacterium]|nr:Ig-like domain-containing protein [Candidatus Acidoferrales bacterium]